MVRGFILEEVYSARLAELKMLVGLFGGGADAMLTSELQEALKRDIVGLELVTYLETGPNSHWDVPEEFAADLTKVVYG